MLLLLADNWIWEIVKLDISNDQEEYVYYLAADDYNWLAAEETDVK